MALRESMLEEFGLGPVWVRRKGSGAVVAGAADAAQALPVVERAGNSVASGATAGSAKPAPSGVTAGSVDDVARQPLRTPLKREANDEVRGHDVSRGASHEPDGMRRSEPPADAMAGRDRSASGASTRTAPPPELAAREFESSSERPRGSQSFASSSNASGLPERRAAVPLAKSAPPSEPPIQPPQALDPSPAQPEPPLPVAEPAFDELPWLDDEPASTTARIDPDVPGDTHTLDWDTLAARVASCERCRLCERRTNTVFGVGDREADWMLIGEAPGENEDKQGEPFVGQAGKLLDSMLRAVTLARDSNVYIANVIKCRPPGNRNPEPDEVARCEPYLQRQVALVKPKVIVALGRFAAQSLLKTDASIASLRGRVHRYEGVPVIVTYHPAYLLRSLPDKAKAWADLCLAQKTYRESLAALGVAQGGI